MEAKNILGSTQPFLLYVNSANRSNPTKSLSTLFNIQLNYPPLHISKITLLSAVIPNGFYAFRNDQFVTNNNFDFIDSTGLPKVAVIPPGNYTIAQLITVFTAALSAVSPDTYTITYDTTRLLLTITSSSALFRIMGATGANVDTNCLYLLGYAVGVDTVAGAVQTAPNMLNIQGPKQLFLKCGNFQTQIHNTTNTFVALFQINLTTSFGEIEYYEQNNRHQTALVVEQRTLNNLDIELIDDFGKIVVMGADWSVLLRFD